MSEKHTLRRVEYDPKEVWEFFTELRAQPTYPVVHGDPLLLLYDLMTVLNFSDQGIYEYIVPRGYLRVAKTRRVSPTRLTHILLEQEDDDDNEEGASE